MSTFLDIRRLLSYSTICSRRGPGGLSYTGYIVELTDEDSSLVSTLDGSGDWAS